MGKDAKIGLLFSLAFVIAIAFILYGVNEKALKGNPGLFKNDGSEASLSSNSEQGNSYRSSSNNYEDRLENAEPERRANFQNNANDGSAVKYQGNLPGNNRDNVIEPEVVIAPSDALINPEPIMSDWPKVHIVSDYENLTEISKKYYGEKEGNRWVNVQRIHKANRNTIPSMDDIKAGQKLVIPALDGSLNVSGRFASNSSNRPLARKTYTVAAGDNLSRIARVHLGSSRRYQEIIDLNPSKISDPDDIAEGMKLLLPAN